MILGRRIWRLLGKLWGLRGRGKRPCRDGDDGVQGQEQRDDGLMKKLDRAFGELYTYCTKFHEGGRE